MSNFWAEMLARDAGQSPAPVAPATEPWWRQNVYGRPATQPQAQAPEPTSAHPYGAAREYATTRARHQSASSSCPACYGENYFKATPNTVTSCFDCGYPVQHSTSGMTTPNTAQEATKAALGQSRGQGYRPDIIVGRI